MPLGTKKLSFLGLLLAFTLILIILSGVLEFNTIFLLAAAAYCDGIAFRESNIRYAFGFFLASVLLGVFLAPNKLYCITYAAMALYILISEFSYDKLVYIKKDRIKRQLVWLIKYIAFNIMYIPALLFLPKLFYEGDINKGLLTGFILAGQIGLFIYDKAYIYFQRYIWGKVRSNFKL